jgi:hypothetical protein
MATNKVVYGNTTLIDLTTDTLTASVLGSGYTAHSRSGDQITGTANLDGAVWGNITGTLSNQTDLKGELDKKVLTKTKAQYDALPSVEKNDPDSIYFVPDYEDTSKTWVALDDTTTANDKVWSSSKISSELASTTRLDDSVTANDKSWSSTKIATELGKKYDMNDTVETDLADDDKFPFYDYSVSAKRNSTWANIIAKIKGALSAVATSGSYNDLSDKPTIPAAQVNSDWNASSGVSEILHKPTLGTAAAKDVPVSGNAGQTEVVLGSDSRLTDARNAADVYSWAKASEKPSYTASEVGAIPSTDKGANNGVASLGSDGKVPSSQLPSYVDDVLEYASVSAFPSTGESGKIYIALDTNKTYRWSGSAYIEISESLALGETSSTAYAGDKGKTNADNILAIQGLIPSGASSSNKLATASDIPSVPSAYTSNPSMDGTASAGSSGSWARGDHVHPSDTSKADNTTSFTEASTRANIASGETIPTILGKIKKYFSDLKDLAYIAKDGTSSTKYLKGDGTWDTPTDTKNTAGSTDTSSKIYLVGATSQAANPQTYSDNEVFAQNGVLSSKKLSPKCITALTGTGTAGQDKGSGSTNRYVPALWTFNQSITVADGEVYFIKIPVAGGTYGVWLSLNNGTNYYPVAISNSSGRFQTNSPINSVIAVSYESAGVCNCYAMAGADSRTDVTGCFRVVDSYDTTYSNMSTSELTTGTVTTSRVVRSDYLKSGINSLIDTKINALDVTGASNIAASKTIKSWSEADGKVNITTQDISITKSQISDFPTVDSTPTASSTNLVESGGVYSTMAHKIKRTGVTASEGSEVRIPASGTDSRITASSYVVPFCDDIDGRGVVVKSCVASTGYATITLGEAISNKNIGVIVINQ